MCLSIALTGSASRKEELERAAELAVERAAERVAERAVEKALESGNSSTETETIRESHSSVRKQDKTWKLPGFIYTPQQRHEYERIAKEREAGELAVAQIKRGNKFFKRAIDDNERINNPDKFYPQFKQSPEFPQQQQQQKQPFQRQHQHKQQQIDINTFPFRSTPLFPFGGQYRYAPKLENHDHDHGHKENFFFPLNRQLIPVSEENGEEINLNNYDRPLEHNFKVTQKNYPIMYYFYPLTTYPISIKYSVPLHAIISHIADNNNSHEYFK